MNFRKMPLPAVVFLLSLTAVQPGFGKSLVNSGGACASQGAWTSRALEQGKLIISTAEQLKNDPDCKVLVEAIQKIDAKAIFAAIEADDALTSGPGAKYETLPNDLMALRTVLLGNPENSTLNTRLSPILAKSTVDLAANSASLLGPLSLKDLAGVQARMKRTAGMGEALLSAVFTSLPQNELCLQKSKNTSAGLNIFAASIRMMAAFSSGGETGGQSLASLLAQFNNFLREMKYAKIISSINISQFWAEMSCLIETTQQMYCGAKDGLQLLEYQSKEAQVLSDLKANLAKGKVTKDSAIEGYLLLSREVAGLTQWLQQVQVGVEAKTTNDANFKNDVWTTVVGLTTSINTLQGTYNENLLLYRALTELDQKQQNVRVLLERISTAIDKPGKLNFFTQSVQVSYLPFYLLGRNAIPDEVLGRGGISQAMDPFKYLEDLARVPELKNPDAAMATIFERLSSLSDLALSQGSKYFAKNMTVDHVNLVDETYTASTVSVYESLKSTRNYIVRLATKYARSTGDAQRLTLSMADTIGRLDRVLRRFSQLSTAAAAYNLNLNNNIVKLDDFSNLSQEEQEKVRGLYKDLVSSVYEEFNLLLQKDAFIAQRLSTYVRFDLYQRLRTKEDLSPYIQYLLVASGKNVMNRLQEFQSFNAAEVEADLSEAQRINRNNLEQIEELFAGDVWTYLNILARDTGNHYSTANNPFRFSWWPGVHPISLRGNRIANQDEDGALAFLRAKVCTQTLGFKSWTHFQELCQGAILQSRMTNNAPKDLHLKFKYSDLVKDKGMSSWDNMKVSFGGAPPEGKRFQHVCALRDFYRNNQVYWLTLDFAQSPAEGASTVETEKKQAPVKAETPNPF